MAPREPTDAEIDAALEALAEPDRFRAAQARVTDMAPQLQHILMRALAEGGWFDDAHESQLRQVTVAPDAERLAAVRTLVAEETRISMLVGVAVGWELARELDQGDNENDHRED